jgi:hypothetical protein
VRILSLTHTLVDSHPLMCRTKSNPPAYQCIPDGLWTLLNQTHTVYAHRYQQAIVQALRSKFIPPAIPVHHVSNDRYCYITAQGTLTELDVVNSTCMRVYWSQRYARTPCLSVIAQHFLLLLPGNKTYCSHCQWCIPACDMDSEKVCSFCTLQSKTPDHTSEQLALTEVQE